MRMSENVANFSMFLATEKNEKAYPVEKYIIKWILLRDNALYN